MKLRHKANHRLYKYTHTQTHMMVMGNRWKHLRFRMQVAHEGRASDLKSLHTITNENTDAGDENHIKFGGY